jgi:hypothetical protein
MRVWSTRQVVQALLNAAPAGTVRYPSGQEGDLVCFDIDDTDVTAMML